MLWSITGTSIMHVILCIMYMNELLYMYAHTCVHVRTLIHVCMYVHTSTCKFMYMYKRLNAREKWPVGHDNRPKLVEAPRVLKHM